MPVNKEALIRYRAINHALRSGRIVDKDTLIRLCSEAVGVDVAWRTIASDIHVMRQNDLLGYHAPIENIRNQGYRYSDPNYSIDQIPLKDDEITALSFAARLLKQYNGVDLFSTASGAVDKLYQNLDVRLHNNISELGDIISFENSTADGGSQHINELLQHIRQKTAITIDYQSFSSGKRRNHVIHPYFIKEYRNRWYILGFHEESQSLRTFALERIFRIDPNYSIVYRPSEIDLKEYYRNAIGVSVTTENPVTVQLKVERNQWPYLNTQPIHHSQKVIEETDQFVIIELHVINNFELRSTILALGSGIEVLQPKALRNQIRLEAERILQKDG